MSSILNPHDTTNSSHFLIYVLVSSDHNVALTFPFLCCSETALPGQTRVGYVKFESATDAGVALHLNNTVFVDRPLNIGPQFDGECYIGLITVGNQTKVPYCCPFLIGKILHALDFALFLCELS